MQKEFSKLLKILPIPLFKDNYAYFITKGNNGGGGVLVDPADA